MLASVLCEGCQAELPRDAAHCPSCGTSTAAAADTMLAGARPADAASATLLSAAASTSTPVSDAASNPTLLAASEVEDAGVAATLLGDTPGLPPTQAHDPVARDDGLDSPDDPLIGQTIAGRFRVERRLGAGGMGTVYVAEQTAVGRRVVLKFLHASLSRQPDLAERFSREALACSKLSAPNTIVLHDFGTAEDGRLFMAMELLEGHTLAELVTSAGALPPLRAIAITLQVLTALAEAHHKGIVHRDLKPENIMLVNRAGTVDFAKVLDFGIAKILTDEGPQVAPVEAAKKRAAKQPDADESSRASRTGPHANTTSNLTQAGEIFGSPRYMAPEQALGEAVGPRTDIYALGVILYELLCGRPPFGGENTLRLLHDHAHTPIKPLAEAFPQLGLPRELSELVQRCLEKDPEQRYGSAKELADALRAVSQVVVQQQQAEERALMELVGVKRRVSRGVIVGVVSALIAAGALAYALLAGPHGAQEGAPLAAGDRVFVAAAGPAPAWLDEHQRQRGARGVRVGRFRGAPSSGAALELAEGLAVARQLDVPLRFEPTEPGRYADDLRLISEAYQKAARGDRLREVGRYWVKLAQGEKGAEPTTVYDGYVALAAPESAVQRATLRKALADRRFTNTSFLLNNAVRRRQCNKAHALAAEVRSAIDDLDVPKARMASMKGYLEQVQLKPCAAKP